MRAWLLGSGGWIPTARRATTSVLVRAGDAALVIDLGTGVRRLLTNRRLLDGAGSVQVVLTHFHLDHVCGLAYLPALSQRVTVFGPGRWLYGRSSTELLEPLVRAPLSPFAVEELPQISELEPGRQRIGDFEVTTSAQHRHWSPTTAIRVGDAIAVVTDTAYDEQAVELAHGVWHLLHEAWSSSTAPLGAHKDATGADAGRVAAAAGVGNLTLIHLNPTLVDHAPILADARRFFAAARLGEDGTELTAAAETAT